MKRLLVMVALTALLSGFGGAKKTKAPTVTAPPPEPVTSRVLPVFHLDRPLSYGALPAALANPTAQACRACHSEQTRTWQSGPHNHGGASRTLREASILAHDPQCLSCHQPLIEQHARVHGEDNPNFQPTLLIEGITCVVCHARDGQIIGPHQRPKSAVPHGLAMDSQLTTSDTCAACHQHQSPDATAPLYDTFGEWSRSPYATARITCQDCHMKPDAQGHNVHIEPGSGFSLMLEAPSLRLTRGGQPLSATIVFQNTGAGHSLPTSSPYTHWRVIGRVTGPSGDLAPTFFHTLGQEISPGPPWQVINDTRIGVQAEGRWEWDIHLPLSAKTGQYTLTLIVEERGGDPQQEARTIFTQTYPLTVD